VDAGFLAYPIDGAHVTSIASNWLGALLVVMALVGTTGLGFYLGVFTCWPWMRRICSRLNGAPLKVGDRVEILSGPLRGTTASVYEILTCQGGWEIARLELGFERRAKFQDIFEEYSVLKIARESDGHSAA
jgi:hypothetical protein